TYLDPLADKAMLIAVCLCLVYLGYLPGWIVALAILRDLLILGGVLLSNVLELELKVEPISISKLNTVLQISMVAFALGQPAVGLDLPQVMSALIYLVTFTTIVSGTLYLARWMGAWASSGGQASAGTKSQ
ncbi:MAG: CDP-alcohol phosphatidyltransferase family protein, partial [Pseudomonadota bacterium]|nr:CDP-alcohol phosphatidyltransferase family protein [Pseudomonadota bacterium]